MLYIVTVIVIVSLLEQTYAVPCSGQQISVCECIDTLVDCENLNLTTVPSNIPITTTKLGLSNNHISTIAEHAFVDLVSLESINLFDNALSSLPAELFSSNINLKIITLQGNNLSSLPAQLFSSNTNLEVINLFKNALKFGGLVFLKHKPGVYKFGFQYFKQFTTRIVFVEHQASDYVKIFFNNALSSLPADLFSSNINLESINLGSNILSSLPPELFSSNTKLRTINLFNNSLSSLPAELFSSNINLKVIFLNSNVLTTISANIFGSLTNISDLNVENNPLVCCDLKDFIEWLDLQTKLTEFSGQCTYLANDTDIRDFNTSECIIPESCKHGDTNKRSDGEWKIPRKWKKKPSPLIFELKSSMK
ncbi:unnamed protein product [Mytilus coruscus]|uniref:Uncharacterized protein n=1 Tax=Mytilus coruscus TaxID=42192 RepID=A0A6J8CYY8_MYTCO|nr:unnamed protein product [Mytilus coruscus]